MSTGESGGDDDVTVGDTADGETEPAACDDPDTQVAWAVDGTLVEPMAYGFADSLGIEVARSWSAEMGTLTLRISTTCEGPLFLWALVWDSAGGVEPENADSLYVGVEGGDEQAWLYGCATDEAVDERWWWLPVQSWTMTACDHEPMVLELPAGDHSIVIRNREGGGDIDVAAIAAVVVSHDFGLDPSQFFPLEEPE